ncbi:Putative cytochrome P450 [Colletotrichum destructivum]|uniref:Cytochrome P450 n=1 Tax=Colletotrichum destructivum TaxID=34406 RepID=A0AAX4ICW4_9PEZI|nr:Putative cytochrome P450 [Colletotrichum destructivum]
MDVVDSAADTLSLNDSLTRQASTSMPENLSATHLAGLATLAVLAIAVLERVTRVSVEANEPPLLKPKVPVFGHILSFLQKPSEYFIQLRKIHNVELATLQLGHAKVYVVWSPAVVHSAFRSKTLSHDKYSLDFAQRVFGLSRDTVALLRSPKAVEDRIQQRLMDAIHDGLMGQSLKEMTARALKYLNNQINELGTGGQGFETSNLYVWLRHHITISVSNTLYGASDPFKKDQSLIQALWDFEGDFTRLIPGKLLGKLLASRAFNGREKVQRAMIDFYRAKSEDNDDVTPFIRTRAELLRQAGLSPDEIGRMEMSFMFVATTGSVPTIFWLLASVLQSREWVEAIRLELEPLVAKQGDTAELRVSSINETSCPLLISSWHEAIRMSNQFLGTRHPLQDMTVMNAEGKSYVLKEGVPVIWTAGALHASTDVWGDDARVFRADRFVDLQGSDKQKKKASFYPFGGGKHLCPGRVFAYSEILPFASALLLGFDIHGLKPESVATGPTRLGEGVLKPLHEGRDSSCTMTKREGWENVQWNLTL